MNKVWEFLKGRVFMAIVIGLIFVVVLVSLIYAITHHTEPGFMADRIQWERDDFPLRVCAHAYAGNSETAQHETENAVDTTNTRLGFPALLVVQTGRCDVQVTTGVPAVVGSNDADGRASWTIGSRQCEVEILNVLGEQRGLAIQHELGHCLGLAHDPDDKTSIMYTQNDPTPDLSFPRHITDSDRGLLNQAYNPLFAEGR